MYIISVSSDCEITLEGLPVNPAAHAVTISNGANWIAYPLSAPMGIADVFDGFAVNGDGISSQTEYSKYTRGNWVGGVNQLEPGKGYIYKSTASGDKEFVFPTGD